MKTEYALAGLLVLLAASSLPAATVWDEAIDGELSADGGSPTPLVVTAGENAWSGQIGDLGGGEVDSDLVAFTVPDGLWLTSLRLDRYDESPDVGGGSFLAIAAGATVETGFGSTHLSNTLTDATGEWLDDLAAGAAFGAPSANVTGLIAPLPAGDYVVWFGELTTRIDYILVATLAVPEPSGLGASIAFVLAGAAVWRRPAV